MGLELLSGSSVFYLHYLHLTFKCLLWMLPRFSELKGLVGRELFNDYVMSCGYFVPLSFEQFVWGWCSPLSNVTTSGSMCTSLREVRWWRILFCATSGTGSLPGFLCGWLLTPSLSLGFW